MEEYNVGKNRELSRSKVREVTAFGEGEEEEIISVEENWERVNGAEGENENIMKKIRMKKFKDV